MMRKPFVAGNWKMNKTVEEARSLVFSMSARLREIKGVEKVLCPPATTLLAVSAMLEGTDIGLGAQNMFWEEKGAFTGELSPVMVKELCGYVILGHSERRQYFGETDEMVNKKVLAAQKFDLTPIVCVGETLAEYESYRTSEVVARQIKFGLADFSPALASKIVVAYEPVWAIGTGRTAVLDDIREVSRHLRKDFGEEVASGLLYGGSVNDDSVSGLCEKGTVHGFLVGTAFLEPKCVLRIFDRLFGSR